MNKKFLFWLALGNLILNAVLLVVNWNEEGLSDGRFSAICGWAVVVIVQS